MTANALEIGKAAEHLVCFDLMRAGYRVFLSDQGLPYDVVVDLGASLLRVQVKSTLGPRNTRNRGHAENSVYHFSPARRGKGGKKVLTAEHCDLVALVAIDIRCIAYFPLQGIRTCMEIPEPGHVRVRPHPANLLPIDCYPFDKAMHGWSARSGAATHCTKGHLLDASNTIFRTDSGRMRCKTCSRLQTAKGRAK